MDLKVYLADLRKLPPESRAEYIDKVEGSAFMVKLYPNCDFIAIFWDSSANIDVPTHKDCVMKDVSGYDLTKFQPESIF